MKRLLRTLIALTLLGLLLYAAYSQRGLIADAFAQVSLGQLLLIVGVTLPLYPLSAAAWHQLVIGVGGRLGYREALAIWMLSNAARLLPGTVWQWVGRVYLAESYGVSKSQTLVTVGYEIAILVVTSVATVLIGLPFWPLGFPLPWWVGLLGIVSLVGLWPSTLPKIVRLYSRIRQQPIREIPTLPCRALVLATLFTLVRSVFNGLALWLLVGIFQPVPLLNAVGLAGIYLLAWLVGYVTIIAPGGVGVADASLAALLGTRVGLSVGAVVALIFRAILFVNELVVTGIAVLLHPKILSEVNRRR